jgi:hypothetical protein
MKTTVKECQILTDVGGVAVERQRARREQLRDDN